jgi:hypothetical protein
MKTGPERFWKEPVELGADFTNPEPTLRSMPSMLCMLKGVAAETARTQTFFGYVANGLPPLIHIRKAVNLVTGRHCKALS